jgi:hypothetical protein
MSSDACASALRAIIGNRERGCQVRPGVNKPPNPLVGIIDDSEANREALNSFFRSAGLSNHPLLNPLMHSSPGVADHPAEASTFGASEGPGPYLARDDDSFQNRCVLIDRRRRSRAGESRAPTARFTKADTGSRVELTPYQQLRGKAPSKRTAAFRSAVRAHARRRFRVGSEGWQGQFQGQIVGTGRFSVTQSVSYT